MILKKIKKFLPFAFALGTLQMVSLSTNLNSDYHHKKYKLKFNENQNSAEILKFLDSLKKENLSFDINKNEKTVWVKTDSNHDLFKLENLITNYNKKSFIGPHPLIRDPLEAQGIFVIDIDNEGNLYDISLWCDKNLKNNYSDNFDSNGYFNKDRLESINKYWNFGRIKNHVKIGVVEASDVQNKNYYWANKNSGLFVTNFPLDGASSIINTGISSYSNHSTYVASIINGVSGVNPFLKVQTFSSKNFNNDLKADIYKEFNVINMSWRHVNGSVDYNNNLDYELDKYIYKNPEKIFVIAAGNKNYDGDYLYFGSDYVWRDGFLNGCANSINSIIVGSHDEWLNYSRFSLWKKSKNKNVNILANGEKYVFTDGDVSEYTGDKSDGTSFSTPFISGILGNSLNLYKNKYDLGYDSIIAKTILTVSSKKLNKDKSTIQKSLSDSGAGAFDYKKMHEAFQNLKYFDFAKSKNLKIDNNREMVIQKNIVLSPNQILNISISSIFNPDLKYYPEFQIILKDPNDSDFIIQSNSIQDSTQFLRFQNGRNKRVLNAYLKINDFNKLKKYAIHSALSWTKGQ
ncbi:hypothetical protein C4M81_02915 [Mycoplasmopsis pullorum]|uniref:S8 family serine peptidase n=1 Tax=Mycoplasmopsis pullorum TaxID=48003 RepID=UPI00111AB4F1|nr:S8 family serine peptidase [Mycoplasmopsis pullorum]TNK84223.1 hypothetical protein C4M81_02915 [Mycoplasmopsis pullorum]